MVKIPDFMISPEEPKRAPQMPWARQKTAAGHNRTELEELLSHIDAGCGYDDWLKVLMAVHHETGGSGEGLAIADQWSAGGNNYAGSKEVEAKWRSFRSSGGVTIATIAQMAADAGADLAQIAARHGRGGYDSDVSPETLREWQEASDRLWAGLQAKRVEAADEASILNDTIGGATEYFDLPDSQLHPGGVVEEIADWICAWTTRPIKLHAIGAALVIVGTLLGRKVFTEDHPVGTALYIAVLARSGLGKDHPINCIYHALDETGGPNQLPQHMAWNASLPSLSRQLTDRASQVMVVDEFSENLLAMRSRNASTTLAAISGGLRTLWGRANQQRWSADLAVTRANTTILWPNLSMYGATTIDTWKTALAGSDISNGLFNRFLVLPRRGKVEPSTRPKKQMVMPGMLLDRLKWLDQCLPPLQMSLAARGDGHPKEPIYVPYSAEAAALYDQYSQEQEDLLDCSGSDPSLVLYARLAEMTKRAALIVACGRRPEDVSAAVIEAPDMIFAHGLVRWSLDQMLLMVRREMVENQFQAQHKMVLDIIRSAGGKPILKGEITRRIAGRIPRKPYEEVLSMLVESGSVGCIEIPTKTKGGRPTYKFWFVKD